ncbi:MAG: Uma2 family endonuclease [Acidimicrobiales bacterium]
MTARTRTTLADLDELPDDGQRYELIDGEMIVTPAPSGPHNQVADRIQTALDLAAPEGYVVLTGYQLHPPGERRLIPDVSVIRSDAYRLLEATEPPVVVVEVLSPSNAAVDLSGKMAAYAAFGVAHYWVADPGTPAVAVLKLESSGRYSLAAEASGAWRLVVQEPFPVEVVPADLLRHRPIDAALEAHVDLPAAVRTALSLQA